MTFNRIHSFLDDITNLLASDSEIIQLFSEEYGKKFSPTTLKQENIITNKIVVIDEDSTHPLFISIVFDNVFFDDDYNNYCVNFKISLGTSNQDTNILKLADRIEELLLNQKIGNSTGELILSAANSCYWNPFLTGVNMVFQLVESREPNGVNI